MLRRHPSEVLRTGRTVLGRRDFNGENIGIWNVELGPMPVPSRGTGGFDHEFYLVAVFR